MALNKESNTYIIGFSIGLVVVVGTLLVVVAMGLQKPQQENVKFEKMQNILQACGHRDIDRKEAGEQFNNYVKERIILDYDGNELSKLDNTTEPNDKDTLDAFSVDLLKEYKGIKDAKKRRYPLYVCESNGQTYYVIPAMGKGLWAAVWGYVSLGEDGSTIMGAVFDHKSETPGLGAEISKDFFELPMIGKSIDENGSYSPIQVIKPGAKLNTHQVDGISGGTFTSVGVDEMLKRTLVVYYDYLKEK